MKRLSTFLLATALVADTATVVIVPAALQSSANQAATVFDPAGGTNTFTIQLASIGGTNATHYWCAARFSDTNRELLSVMAAQPPFSGQLIIADYDPDTDPAAPSRMLATNGLTTLAVTSAP